MPEQPTLSRRAFVAGSAAAAGALSLAPRTFAAAPRPDYAGPNVVIIRFGGGVRRSETIAPETTWAPYFLNALVPRGVLFPQMNIDQFSNATTSHGEGTLYILTGKYEKYQDIEKQFLASRFEAPVPTVFEYLRKAYNVPEHQTLIVNGEDRTDEEFYTFSNHHLFGVNYRSAVLSLFRYKTFLLRRILAEDALPEDERVAKEKILAEMESLDYRAEKEAGQPPAIERFWEHWRADYGDSGLKNPRGDRLLTELSLRAMRELQPRLLMVNYNDPDYVHWGNPSHYYRGIQIIDEGIRQIVAHTEQDEFYRDNTVFVIVPDCGRDTRRGLAVPFQHHFGSASSHEIFAYMTGPGIDRGMIVDRPTDQICIASTIGHIMGFKAEHAEAQVLTEAFA